MLLTASLGSMNNPEYTLLTFCAVTALTSLDKGCASLLTGISFGLLSYFSSETTLLFAPKLRLTVDNSIAISINILASIVYNI